MNVPTLDPRFQDAVDAIDSGDAVRLERLLAEDPGLVRDRVGGGEGYFSRPYLLWFVAENPVRNGRLPANIFRTVFLTQGAKLIIEKLLVSEQSNSVTRNVFDRL